MRWGSGWVSSMVTEFHKHSIFELEHEPIHFLKNCCLSKLNLGVKRWSSTWVLVGIPISSIYVLHSLNCSIKYTYYISWIMTGWSVLNCPKNCRNWERRSLGRPVWIKLCMVLCQKAPNSFDTLTIKLITHVLTTACRLYLLLHVILPYWPWNLGSRKPNSEGTY